MNSNCCKGGCSSISHMEKRAIGAGVAEYYLDADNERQFRYFTNETKKARTK